MHGAHVDAKQVAKKIWYTLEVWPLQVEREASQGWVLLALTLVLLFRSNLSALRLMDGGDGPLCNAALTRAAQSARRPQGEAT